MWEGLLISFLRGTEEFLAHLGYGRGGWWGNPTVADGCCFELARSPPSPSWLEPILYESKGPDLFPCPNMVRGMQVSEISSPPGTLWKSVQWVPLYRCGSDGVRASKDIMHPRPVRSHLWPIHKKPLFPPLLEHPASWLCFLSLLFPGRVTLYSAIQSWTSLRLSPGAPSLSQNQRPTDGIEVWS